jgi:hypothetical protein
MQTTRRRGGSRIFTKGAGTYGERVKREPPGVWVVSLIESCRTEQSFSCLYAACVNEAERLKLDPPVLPRQRRIPARLLDGGSQPVIFHDPQSRCRQKYYEFLETAAAAIRSRYNQAGFQMCIKIETMLKSALSQQMEHDQAVEHRTQVEKDLNDICQHYGDDLEPRKLMRQLEVLRDVCRDQQINTVRDVCLCLMKFSCMYDEVFSEVSRLIRLFLVIPATSATAERSFSTLRRLKTYMRSTMTAHRLNSLMIMHVHSEILDELNDLDTAVEFADRNSRRKDTFGLVK